MAAKIETLDADGWARIHAHREAVLARCLHEPFDRDRIADGARACYRYIGEPEPLILWAPGPLTTLVWSAVIRGTDPTVDQLGDQLRDQLWDQLGGQLGGQLGDQLWDQLRDQLWGQLRGQLWGQLRDQLWDQLGDQLWGQLGDQLRDAATPGWWIAGAEHYDALARIDGVSLPADLLAVNRAFADLCTVPMFVPLRGACILVDRHEHLHRDTQGRLHSTTGPAWSWPDGTAVYALDGIRVPAWVIDDPSPARILSDLPTTEHRRVALAHYGWDRAVEDLALDVIDTADDPTWGTLYRLPDEISDGQATLLVAQNASPDRDGTVRTYGLLAAADCRTVVAAQASLAQLSEAEWLALDGAS